MEHLCIICREARSIKAFVAVPIAEEAPEIHPLDRTQIPVHLESVCFLVGVGASLSRSQCQLAAWLHVQSKKHEHESPSQVNLEEQAPPCAGVGQSEQCAPKSSTCPVK